MEEDTKIFGFWVYLMTDLVIFAVLFAVFAVLRNHTFGGPSGRDLFQLPLVMKETFILLISSFTCALATYSILRQKKQWAIIWFAVTFLLGISFLFLEFSEFSRLIDIGASWKRSAFLSSYFTLVGTHGLHISVGLLWLGAAILRIGFKGLSKENNSQFFRLAYFWHFLDFVWIFIFTVVYGMELLTYA